MPAAHELATVRAGVEARASAPLADLEVLSLVWGAGRPLSYFLLSRWLRARDGRSGLDVGQGTSNMPSQAQMGGEEECMSATESTVEAGERGRGVRCGIGARGKAGLCRWQSSLQLCQRSVGRNSGRSFGDYWLGNDAMPLWRAR